MKKIYFVMAVLATALLASCEKEKYFDNIIPVKEGDIAFAIQGATTKSGVGPEVETGVSISVGKGINGQSFCLEETIENLNPTPSTKGAPAYTHNVGTLYTTMGVYAKAPGEDTFAGDATFERMDGTMTDNPNGGQGWRYYHNYAGSDPWPDETTPVDFYLRMPAAPTGVSNLDYADGVDDAQQPVKQLSFSYSTPSNGQNQQDILLGFSSINKEQHQDYLPEGAPVMMYHALTGVKFRNGHSNDGSTKTIITKVQFKGIRSTGTCTFTPGEEGVSKDKIEWSGLDNGATFTLDFSSLNPTYVPADGADNPDGTISYGSDSKYAGTSWTSAAADHNLNDEDGSFTFWFIPQQIEESVTLEVTFLVKTPDTPDGTEVPHIIEFGKLVTKTTGEGESATKTYTEWKAGQLRTYTLKPFDVDVEIFDSMTNLTKDNLHVTNTGNVDEYVRIMVIGNWYGWKSAADKTANPNNPMILVGYTSDDPDDDTMVEPWFRENPVYAAGFDSTFPGGRPLASSHWKRGTGSYFYYDQVIGAGQQLSGTDALFQHYELEENMIPAIYLPVANQTTRQAAVGVHLVMEVVVQAIPTTKPDGTEFATCWEAWSYAVGKEIKAK